MSYITLGGRYWNILAYFRGAMTHWDSTVGVRSVVQGEKYGEG